MTDQPSDLWGVFAAEVEAWDGDVDTGRALLARLTGLPELPGKAVPLIDALRKLRKGREHLLKGLVEGPAGGAPPPLQLLRLLATDPDLVWPWARHEEENVLRHYFVGEPADVSARSRRLARAAIAVAPLAGSLTFLESCLKLKQREQWVPVAAAVAEALAGPHADRLAALNLEALCEEVSKKPKGAKDANAEDAEEDDDSTFIPKRHRVILATLGALLRGAKFGGLDARGWLQREDRNEDDLSAIALACVELAELRPDLEPALKSHADQALTLALAKFQKTLTYQHAEAARRLIEKLGDADGAWSVLLRDVPTHSVGAAAERLYEAHETSLWLLAHNDQARLTLLTEGPLACAPTLVLATRYHPKLQPERGEATDWLPLLRTAFEQLAEQRWDASPTLARAVSLVVALVLARAPLAADLDWPKVVAAVGASWLEPSEGKTAQRGWVDLVGLAAKRDALFRFLLHSGSLDGPRVQAQDDAKARAAAARDLYGPRETVGLARLLQARWRPTRDGKQRVDTHITNQCAQHLVRRLAVADPAEAAQVFLAALAADAPQRGARHVDQRELKDKLWQAVRKNLPHELDRGPLPTVLDKLIAMERERSPDGLQAEADSYREATNHYTELQAVSASTDQVWRTLSGARVAWAALSKAPPVANAPEAAAKPDAETRFGKPDEVRSWVRKQLLPLAEALANASCGIERALGEDLPDKTLRKPDIDTVRDAGNDELIDLDLPVLDAAVQARWRATVQRLHRLAKPLPAFVEAALDDLLVQFEAWLAHAETNATTRKLLLERIDAAIDDQNEEQAHARPRGRQEDPPQGQHWPHTVRPPRRAEDPRDQQLLAAATLLRGEQGATREEARDPVDLLRPARARGARRAAHDRADERRLATADR